MFRHSLKTDAEMSIIHCYLLLLCFGGFLCFISRIDRAFASLREREKILFKHFSFFFIYS